MAGLIGAWGRWLRFHYLAWRIRRIARRLGVYE